MRNSISRTFLILFIFTAILVSLSKKCWAPTSGGGGGDISGTGTAGKMVQFTSPKTIADGTHTDSELNSMFELMSDYPYVLDWQQPPVTDDLTVSFYAMDVFFTNKVMTIPAFTHSFTADKITNVWLNLDGTFTYEEKDLPDYTDFTRYPDKLMIVEVTTGPTKVVDVYYRGNSRSIKAAVATQPINADEILLNYYIKPHNKEWGAIPVVYGDVVRTPLGNLYAVLDSGTLTETQPPIPLYSFESHTGFHDQKNGTATISYIGKDTYEGVWKYSYMSTINWYFSNLGIAYIAKSKTPIADELADEMLNHIRTEVDRACRPWQASTGYSYAMLITDPAGYVWQARNDGTSDDTVTFPLSPVVGTDTHIDNDITWKCFGRTSVNTPAVDWQLVDANVTMDEYKYPDSHDSYASTLMYALEQLRLGGYVPDAFFTEVSKHGITYLAAIQNILYNNILIQVANDMSKTFQYDIFPDGSGDVFDIQYLMDNCEVYQGLQAAHDFFSDSRYTVDPTYPAYVESFRDTILAGINSLWDTTYEVFAYYRGFDISTTPNDPLFYPWVMAQAWPKFSDVPVDYYKTRSCFSYMQTQYPDWWQLNNIDDVAAIGAHMALYKYDQTNKIRQEIFNRVENEKMFTTGEIFMLQDLGYYLYMKSGAVADTSRGSSSTSSGTITGVVAGTGLSGGGTSGSITLNSDMPYWNDWYDRTDGETLISPYIVKSNTYKGQLHCHTTHSDGVYNETDLANKYVAAGYNFMAFTDHSTFISSLITFPAVGGITFLTGEEATNDNGHISLIGLTSYKSYDGTNVETVIKQVYGEGGYSSFNHPVRSPYEWSEDELYSYYGYKGIEVYNYGSNSNAESLWDALLLRGKNIYGFAADDCHNDTTFDGAWVVVNSDTNADTDILANLEAGNFYASTGPTLTVSLVGTTLTATTGAAATIAFIGNGGTVLQSTASATTADYTIVGNEVYVRVRVTRDSDSKKAWSNPIRNVKSIFTGSGTIGGSGADNYIPRFDGTTDIESSVIYQTAAGNIGINTESPKTTSGGLDIACGGFGLVFGADDAKGTRTDSTTKRARAGMPHFLNANNPIVFWNGNSSSASSVLTIGGGTSSGLAFTQLDFNTAPDTQTTTGTTRMRILSDGSILLLGLTSNGLVQTSGGNGLLSIDTTTQGKAHTQNTDTGTNSATFNLPSAGNITVNSANVFVSKVFTSNMMYPSTTNGCTQAESQVSTTYNVSFNTSDFVDSDTKYVEGDLWIPDNYSGGTIQYRIEWYTSDAATNSVVWGVQGRFFGAGSLYNQAFGTAVTTTDANTASYANQITDLATGLSGAGTPAGGKNLHFRIFRDGANPTDTLTNTAHLIMIVFEIPINAYGE